MRRVKITHNFGNYKSGDIVFVTPNEAHGIIDAGKGVLTKDMTGQDMKVKKKTRKKKSLTGFDVPSMIGDIDG